LIFVEFPYRTKLLIDNKLQYKNYHLQIDKSSSMAAQSIYTFSGRKAQAINLFNFINQLNENASFIITINKILAD